MQVCQKLAVSERRACQVLGQARTTQHRELSPPSDEKQLTKDIIDLAAKYGRYGYRRVTALLNNDKQTGTTIIKMDKGLDTGAILAQSPLPILVSDNAGSLHDKLAKLSSQLLIPTIKKYLDGKIKPRPQDDNLASYAPKLKKSDGLINWNKTASENESFIRAMSPWPSAWTWWKGKQIKIISVQHLPLEINSYKPGKIFIYNSGLFIQCGKDALIIKKLQLEGKKELSSEEFLRGQRDFIGTILT